MIAWAAKKRPAISEIQANSELATFENLVSRLLHIATLLHSRSPVLCALGHVQTLGAYRCKGFLEFGGFVRDSCFFFVLWQVSDQRKSSLDAIGF